MGVGSCVMSPHMGVVIALGSLCVESKMGSPMFNGVTHSEKAYTP